ncbi:MAG TPA: hypothetical protein VF605_02925 [Allosphingosinicella sp.]|jgi:hypothetical protein
MVEDDDPAGPNEENPKEPEPEPEPKPEPEREACASAEDSPEPSGEDGRIGPGRNREAQVRRDGERKLFDEAAKKAFLEWFAATCNAAWAAERAGFNYKTVWKHRMNDPVFADAYDRAEEQALARLRAKRLETKRKPLKIGVEGDWDAPEMDDIDPILASTLLREHDGKAGRPRKTGRVPRVASNAEVRAALVRRLGAYGVRVFGEPPSPSASAAEGAEAPGPLHQPLAGPPHSDPDGVAHGEEL